MAEGMANAGAMLFGRRTYLDFFEVWPKRRQSLHGRAQQSPRVVASTTLRSAALGELDVDRRRRARGGGTPQEGQTAKTSSCSAAASCVRSLMQHRLVDEFVLIIHPLVFGSGQRLFDDGGTFEKLRLIKATRTTTGVVIAHVPGSAVAEDHR